MIPHEEFILMMRHELWDSEWKKIILPAMKKMNGDHLKRLVENIKGESNVEIIKFIREEGL